MPKYSNHFTARVSPLDETSNTSSAARALATSFRTLPGWTGAEPLDEDRADDRIRVVTQRQLNRVLFVAAEAGARLARDDSPHDPAAWMYAPLRLFDGRSAIDACRDRDAFLKAMLLHGAGLALDMEPAEMDELLDESWDEVVDGEPAVATSPAVRACGTRASLADFGLGRPELFTASAVVEGSGGVVHAFAAFLANDEEEATDRVRARFGDRADLATLRRGFDPSEPVAMSLLSEPVADILIDVSADAGSPLADGLDVFVEHGFAA